jgi:hypothetical protein
MRMMFVSVIVLVIHDFGIGTHKFESNTPIPAHPNSPRAFSSALERMESKARKVHVSRCRGRVQSTKDQAQPFGMLSLNSGLRSGLKVARQALMLEASDHGPYCNPYRYRLQDA